jgi:hypothetical protein
MLFNCVFTICDVLCCFLYFALNTRVVVYEIRRDVRVSWVFSYLDSYGRVTVLQITKLFLEQNKIYKQWIGACCPVSLVSNISSFYHLIFVLELKTWTLTFSCEIYRTQLISLQKLTVFSVTKMSFCHLVALLIFLLTTAFGLTYMIVSCWS